MTEHDVRAGSLSELQATGRLLTKVGTLPVVVFWNENAAFAIEDRCPHLGFPLHQGTVEAGLVTCHWHHARFDLVSGCTLDLWADDARGFDVNIRGDDVFVQARVHADPVGHLQARLRNGLEDDISLVVAKSVLGLLEAGVPASEIVRTGVEFGTRYRNTGWGAGLTVLVAMANLLPQLAADDQALALVHGLTFVARHAESRAPFRSGPARNPSGAPGSPRELVPTVRRHALSDAAERTLETALAEPGRLADVEAMMFAAVTDHVFIDGGHTIDFTNKAFEAVEHLGKDAAAEVLPTLVRQTTAASRSEEFGEWRHPHNHAALARRTIEALDGALADGSGRRGQFHDVGALGRQLLDDDPEAVAGALLDALRAGADEEQVGRAVAFAAALRIVHFHVQNDHGDWDTVHHAFTASNGLHQALQRRPTTELLRGAVHAALRINLDRFLNVPAARPPHSTSGSLDALARCFDVQGMVDEAGNEAYGFLHNEGTRAELVAALGHALLAEDAEFHWYQVLEAGVRQSQQWPEGSEEAALVLTAVARFLSAHTPTRRELPTVVRIATRLRRGEALYEEEEASAQPALEG